MKHSIYTILLLGLIALVSCSKDDDNGGNTNVPESSYNPQIPDNYSDVAAFANRSKWGPYNLHDPSIIKDGDTYYVYSTDVAYGPNGQCGIMYRKSTDLVQWQFLGWVFDSFENNMPSIEFNWMADRQSGYEAQGIWAPYIIKVGEQFRLYYSVPGNNSVKLACIGLATSASPTGPWEDKGIVVSCLPSQNYNAIDPAVITDADNGKQWFLFGSYSAGLYISELDPATGFRKNTESIGTLVAKRTKTHDAIEGGEILYNSELKKYFLFQSYDWLEDNYNVRVGRSDKPEGPYIDYFGKDLASTGDKFPIITARYKFNNHVGWQGFGHCGLLHDGENYYYISQARPSNDKYIMDMHIHRMLWTSDGWPVISPERYVNVPQITIPKDSLIGAWECINLAYTAQTNASAKIELLQDGTATGTSLSTWSYDGSELILNYTTGKVVKARVSREWDWENKHLATCFTGLSTEGRSVWGKKSR